MENEQITHEELYYDDQISNLFLSTKIGLFTLLNGRKWVLYVAIAIFPLLISWISNDYLFSEPDAKSAFILMYGRTFYIFLFTFGVMLISLPVSADETTDNVIDLYLVRPISRDVYWTSRWIVINMGVFIINAGIVLFYWIYFNLVDNGFNGIDTAIGDIFSEIGTFLKMLVLVFVASFTYSGLFHLVGSVGNRGFTLGILLALTETFFISLLFLEGSGYIPRTHLNQLAYLSYKTELSDLETNFSFEYALSYLFIFGIVSYILGILYFRRKQFN